MRVGVASEVAKLKERLGRELQVRGSGELAQTLVEHDLVDEHRLLVPVILGSGKKPFRDGLKAAALQLTSTSATKSGVVLATYQPAGAVRRGSYMLKDS